MAFNDRLKQLRTEKNLKQSELAEVLGVTPATISAYEKGIRTPDINVATQLASFFNVSVDNLLSVPTPKEVEIVDIINSGSLTYNGSKISDHNLKVLTGVVKAFLEEEGNESDHN